MGQVVRSHPDLRVLWCWALHLGDEANQINYIYYKIYFFIVSLYCFNCYMHSHSWSNWLNLFSFSFSRLDPKFKKNMLNTETSRVGFVSFVQLVILKPIVWYQMPKDFNSCSWHVHLVGWTFNFTLSKYFCIFPWPLHEL